MTQKTSVGDDAPVNPYSEDLRRRIVQAAEGEMSKFAAARLFGVSVSSVKRYLRIAQWGMLLAAEKDRRKALPKFDQTAEKPLKVDVRERLARATVSERRRFLECTTGTALSASTVKRLLKRLGFSRKNESWGDGAKRMAKSCLEGDGLGEGEAGAVCLCRRDGAKTSLCVLRAWSRRGERVYCSVPRTVAITQRSWPV